MTLQGASEIKSGDYVEFYLSKPAKASHLWVIVDQANKGSTTVHTYESHKEIVITHNAEIFSRSERQSFGGVVLKCYRGVCDTKISVLWDILEFQFGTLSIPDYLSWEFCMNLHKRDANGYPI